VAALAAGVLLLLVAVGVVSVVAMMLGPGESEAVPAPDAATASSAAAEEDPFADFTPRPEESASASASASPSSAPAEECGDALVLRASTDRGSYSGAAEPVLELTLANTGEAPCHVNAGTSQMVYEVSSGADTVFDSRHCQVGSEDRELTLEPGQEQTARLTWDRRRTAEGCAEAGEPVQSGYYRLAVSLGERTGEPASFVLE